MPGFQSLPVRDLVALLVTFARSLRLRTLNPRDAVTFGFTAADEFIDQSEAHWARAARENRRRSRHSNHRDTQPPSSPNDQHQ